ncbi:MAG: hypothetical protein ACRDWY_01815 [Actinomycetes bacterium]
MTDPGAQPAQVLALPSSGVVLGDTRSDARWMRVTWHPEADLVVLSLWRDGSCVGTLRVARGQVPELVNALVAGLADEGSVGARGGS